MTPAPSQALTPSQHLVKTTTIVDLGRLLRIFSVNAARLPPYIDWSDLSLRKHVEEVIETSDVTIIFDATEQLVRDCHVGGYQVRVLHLYDCYRTLDVDPQRGWSKKARYNLRRARHQLEQLGTVTTKVNYGGSLSPDSFERFVSLLGEAALDGRRIDSKWSKKQHRGQFERVISAPDSLVFELLVGNVPVAVAQCNKVGNSLVYMVPTYDANFARFSPGMVLLLEIARYCEQNGLVLDLGKGAAEYKSRIAGESYPLYLAVVSRSFSGCVISLCVWSVIRSLVFTRRTSKRLARSWMR